MELFGVSALDLAVLGVLSLAALIGLATGFTRPALFAVAWAVAILASLYFYPHTSEIAAGFFAQDWAVTLAAGLIPFVIVLVILSIVGQVLSEKIRQGALGHVDRALGATAGVVVGAAVLGGAYMLLEDQYGERPHPSWVTEAVSRPYVERVAAITRSVMPTDLLDNPAANFADVSERLGDVSSELATQPDAAR